jgi:hypothetical protein
MIPRRVFLFWIGGLCCAQTVYLPPVNLASSETAQVAIMSSAAAYVGGSFLTPCNAVVTFYGSDDSAIGTPTNFSVGDTRQIYTAQLPYATASAKGSSTAISARIALTPQSGVFSVLGPPIPPCAVAFSFETFDTATGISHAFVTGWAVQSTTLETGTGVGLAPACLYGSLCDAIPLVQRTPQNIVLPPIGLGATETAGVNLLNTAPAASCGGSVAFYDGAGTMIGASSNFTVATGQISSIQLPAGSNALVRAEITLATTPGPVAVLTTLSTAPCALLFSLDTYDSTTGATHALVSGTTSPVGLPGIPKVGLPR